MSKRKLQAIEENKKKYKRDTPHLPLVCLVSTAHASVNFINEHEPEFIVPPNDLSFIQKITYTCFGLPNFTSGEIDKNIIYSLLNIDKNIYMQNPEDFLTSIKNNYLIPTPPTIRSTLDDEITRAGLTILQNNSNHLYKDFVYDSDNAIPIINKTFVKYQDDNEFQNIFVVFSQGDNLRLNLPILGSKELEELAQEFQFMKDVNNVEELKKVIKEVGGIYWADNWATSSLERLYNVKFIILSQAHFVEGEKEHFLQCTSDDKKLEERGLFEPSYYIIADYFQNNHYKLITYDKNIKRGALTFSEVPYKIKELILERCMEKNAGLYVLIPDFKAFANKNGVETSSISKKSAYTSLVDTKKPLSQDYDDSIVIQVYNKSKHAKVGEGSGETIKPELKIAKNVLELNNKKKYPEWRKKLDNDFFVTNLKIDGINWTSVKHYMLASRFNGLTDIYSKFKKDGLYGSNIEEAQQFYESQLAKKSIKSTLTNDEEFKKNEPVLLEKALYAKFTQNDDLRELLLLTDNALINNFKQGKGASPFIELMKVRKLITK